jgi:nitronate monooxygenase
MNLKKLLGTELPIIQAPMAGVQLGRLAIAVSKAGALGSLPCAMLSLEAMSSELESITAQTSRPINVNFFCHTPPAGPLEQEARWRATLEPYYRELGVSLEQTLAGPERAPFSDEAADILEKFKPAVVSFHFGLPSRPLLERVRAMGCTILSSATTVEEARWLEAAGVDAIIAQGVEAGGHRGMFLSNDISTQVGTFALLPQVVQAVSVPVIAAGGIADARGVAAARALGAEGVLVGTAYMLCPEADTSAIHRSALSNQLLAETALTNVFTGRPARGIVNRLVREVGPMSALAPPFPLATRLVAPLRAKAESQGSGDFSPLWSGQNRSGCKAISAATITHELAGALC